MSETYESLGAKLSFQDTGTGVPVVFLHPTPLDHVYWEPLVAKLAGIRAILPDFRGHGASEMGAHLPVGGFTMVPDASVLTMEQLAGDILALLDHLGIEQAVFAGCSIGGYVLMELWRKAPQRMQGLAIVCSKPQPDSEVNLARRAATIAQARAGETSAIFDGMAQVLIGATARAGQPQIVPELRARMTLSAEDLVAVHAGLAARQDSVPTVGTITVPILAITGGEDPGVTEEEMSAFEAAPGGCQHHTIPDAGHFAAYEQPERIASLFVPWLGQFQV